MPAVIALGIHAGVSTRIRLRVLLGVTQVDLSEGSQRIVPLVTQRIFPGTYSSKSSTRSFITNSSKFSNGFYKHFPKNFFGGIFPSCSFGNSTMRTSECSEIFLEIPPENSSKSASKRACKVLPEFFHKFHR